jgi:glutamate formiminotransferase
MRYKEFPFHEVVERVIEEAEKRKIRYAGTELVGLVTGDVLYAGLEKYLRLVDFQPRQILDLHIGDGSF